MPAALTTDLIRFFEDLRIEDVPLVGGKNASLGEMIHSLREKEVAVPGGFATTSKAYWDFVEANNLKPELESLLKKLESGQRPLQEIGKAIRQAFLQAKFPEDLKEAICQAYQVMGEQYNQDNLDVAVRSSATAEDLPEASFAGQQETFLNIHGEAQLLDACRRCYASLFTDRAINYRREHGFDHLKVALSIGVQKMIRSDKAGSGVMFTLDTESGFPDVVIINAAWG